MDETTKRFRSPPYPALSLEKAVTRARELREVARGHSITLLSAAKAWGFSAKSSSITSVAGALIQFGLIEDEGSGPSRRVRLSRLGESIVMDQRPGSPDRVRALGEAALSPPVFRGLWEKYSSADVDEHMLIYDLTLGRSQDGSAPFSESAALEVARLFKESLDFAQMGDRDDAYQGGEAQDRSQGAAPDTMSSETQSSHSVSKGSDTFEEQKALDEGSARLSWPRDLSPESADDMEYWLRGVIRQIKRRAGMTLQLDNPE